jgi:hypothetical protein
VLAGRAYQELPVDPLTDKLDDAPLLRFIKPGPRADNE